MLVRETEVVLADLTNHAVFSCARGAFRLVFCDASEGVLQKGKEEWFEYGPLMV